MVMFNFMRDSVYCVFAAAAFNSEFRFYIVQHKYRGEYYLRKEDDGHLRSILIRSIGGRGGCHLGEISGAKIYVYTNLSFFSATRNCSEDEAFNAKEALVLNDFNDTQKRVF